jgi:hypothetical protein
MPSELKERHITEIKCPKQTEAFRDTTNKMYQVHLQKNSDYSPANILVAGEVGVIIRIWDKFCRICNLMGLPFPALGPEVDKARTNILNALDAVTKDGSNNMSAWEFRDIVNAEFDGLIKKTEFDYSKIIENQPANEPLDDAWLDMANYSVIGYIKRKGAWGR